MRGLHLLAILVATCGPVQAQSVTDVQSALTLLGYDPGPADGAWGSKSRAALEAYYQDRSMTFDGELDRNDYQYLAWDLSELVPRDVRPEESPGLNLSAHFFKSVLLTVPHEFAFSDGESEPKVAAHNYTVPFPIVGDVDGDGCDDLLMQFGDSLAHPRILYGREGLGSDGKPISIPTATDFPKTRTIRNVSQRDVSGDGQPDFVAFTAPHRLDGIGFAPLEEPDVVVVAGEARETSLPSYAHGGLVGDVNGDGIPDIFPVTERTSGNRFALLGSPGEFDEKFSVTALRSETIFGAAAADLNGDGRDDFVFLTSGDYVADKRIDPTKASVHGTFAVALGQAGKSINELEFVRYGQHWMDKLHWTLFRLLPRSDAGYDLGEDWYYAAPSNLDLLDIDADGDLDILVGYFASSRSTWLTSGFQIYRNDGGLFSDATADLVPHQPQNRVVTSPTDAMIRAQMVDLNGDRNEDLLLTIQTDDRQPASKFRSAVYLKVGNQFAPVRAENDVLSGLRYVYAGDFNCDGHSDLVGLGAKGATEQGLRLMLGKAEDLSPGGTRGAR